jgi:hypothetical protein
MINVAQMARINKIVTRALAPEPSGEVNNAISALQKIFRENNLKAVDFELVPTGSHLDCEHQDNAATASLRTQIADLTMRLNAAHREIGTLKAARTYGFAEQRVHADLSGAGNAKAKYERDAARRESAKLRKVLANSTIKLNEANRAKSEADVLRARLAKLEATLDQTNAELIKVIRAKAEAEVRADKACRERDDLRAALEKTTAELHEADQAKVEVEAKADAMRRKHEELQAAFDETRTKVREAQQDADALCNATVSNGPSDAAATVVDTQTGSVHEPKHLAEGAEGPAGSHHSDKTAATRQKGWNPNFSAKAVEIYWRTVRAIDVDLAAGPITKPQASRRKAAAHRNYKAGAKPVDRTRTARSSAA